MKKITGVGAGKKLTAGKVGWVAHTSKAIYHADLCKDTHWQDYYP
jgi:hypothetical protein